MASNIAQLNVTALDFDTIKSNLIEYFKADPTFSDYAFEGSALNILIDILAYNTHMNAVMANMSANEMFIDTAQLRESVVSIAKALAYTPRSVRTSQAEISITFNNISGAPAYITIPAGTRFSSNSGYVFSSITQSFAYPTSLPGEYKCDSLEIFEGVKTEFTYTVDYNDPDQRFIIPSVDADVSTLTVKSVAGALSITNYELNENITLLTPDSLVYFLHENPSGFFEVTFGDDVLGKRPLNGSKVVLSYIVSKGKEDAVSSSVFSAYQMIDGYSSYTIETLITAFGAAEKETKEEIQFRAPKIYKSQNRAVVTEDYENFMLQEYPFIESMSVWGGEFNDPPMYGRVFFAIKPYNAEFLSDNLKAKIKEELITKYNVVTVIPEITDPTYLFISCDIEIISDKTKTVLSDTELKSTIVNNILNYSYNYLQKFNSVLYFSKFLKIIDETDSSISGSLLDLTLMVKIFPTVNVTTNFTPSFSNAIEPGSITSSYFNSGTVGSTARQSIFDDGAGVLYTKNSEYGNIVQSNIGSVDYTTGKLDFDLLPYTIPSDTLDVRIYATPVSENVTPNNNQIIIIDNSAYKQEFNRKQGITVTITQVDSEYK